MRAANLLTGESKMNYFAIALEDAAGSSSSAGLISTLLMVAVVVVAFYFFLIRPQKKRDREINEMRDSLCVGDEVTTIGGIIGKIVSIKDETCMIETGRDRVRIRFLKSAIRCVDVPAEAERARIAALKAEEEKKEAEEKARLEAQQAAGKEAMKAGKKKKKKSSSVGQEEVMTAVQTETPDNSSESAEGADKSNTTAGDNKAESAKSAPEEAPSQDSEKA